MWFWLWWLLSLWLNVDSFDSDFWSFLLLLIFSLLSIFWGGYLVERITIMKKVFKPKLYRIVLNGFYGIFAGVLVTVIVGYISNNVVYAFIGGILAIILYVYYYWSRFHSSDRQKRKRGALFWNCSMCLSCENHHKKLRYRMLIVCCRYGR